MDRSSHDVSSELQEKLIENTDDELARIGFDPEWAPRLGNTLTAAQAAKDLGLSEHLVARLVHAGVLLGAHASDGTLAIPAFGLNPDKTLVPGLAEVTAILRTAFDEWAIVVWAYHRTRLFSGLNALELLRDGHQYPVQLCAWTDATAVTGLDSLPKPAPPPNWDWERWLIRFDPPHWPDEDQSQ